MSNRFLSANLLPVLITVQPHGPDHPNARPMSSRTGNLHRWLREETTMYGQPCVVLTCQKLMLWHNNERQMEVGFTGPNAGTWQDTNLTGSYTWGLNNPVSIAWPTMREGDLDEAEAWGELIAELNRLLHDEFDEFCRDKDDWGSPV